MYLVKIRMQFAAAHRLCREDLSDEENFAIYGKCANPNGHGHNYDLEVAVEGELDPATGMVVNFYDLQRVVEEHIFNKVDHKNLNKDVDFLHGVIPTAENLARCFWEVLEPHVRPARLFSITVAEGEANVVTYFGPRNRTGVSNGE
ncbi:MAG: 6-carboxytetrahydropterin synthase [Candidatus Sumerlaea chitinivorans]|jgi:6-pyruvoyltetrahydropterin/6-carboxytetrahydropterin synthase|uniref:6-carboxy-5,6,7,8-tetrahydropterin synthase n=1 Tax=Sumerlaea chitinivorans TaxID=2250252 RepID=A0A2Z4Y849_SUMC1|nr:6-pyruvoyl tetrahydrobiopterin synthase [Candidatus Sumerlaea chitinivorans]MCX7963809.1 6-carboxytetrahydropterin synthase [Candidatus Sumerlaea chitinivorans]